MLAGDGDRELELHHLVVGVAEAEVPGDRGRQNRVAEEHQLDAVLGAGAIEGAADGEIPFHLGAEVHAVRLGELKVCLLGNGIKVAGVIGPQEPGVDIGLMRRERIGVRHQGLIAVGVVGGERVRVVEQVLQVVPHPLAEGRVRVLGLADLLPHRLRQVVKAGRGHPERLGDIAERLWIEVELPRGRCPDWSRLGGSGRQAGGWRLSRDRRQGTAGEQAERGTPRV